MNLDRGGVFLDIVYGNDDNTEGVSTDAEG